MPDTVTATTPIAPPPSAAPATAPKSAQPSPPASAPAAPTSDSKPPAPIINDAFSEIDKIISESQQKRPDRPQKPVPDQQTTTPQDQKTVPAEQTKEKNDPKSTKLPEVPVPDEAQTLKAPELRNAYANLKRSHKETQEKLTAAEARLKELESTGTSLTQLQEELASTKKSAAELAEKIKYVDYEKSPEYKDKYLDPFINAYQTARTKVSSLKIVERKNDLDEVTQTGRKATIEDFDAIMRIADDGEAAEKAEQLFGPTANLVLLQREKVMDLNTARVNAIEEYRTKGGEREKLTAAQAQAMRERAVSIFQKAKEEGAAKYPQWFKPDDGDDAGKSILEKGMKNADMLFAKSDKSPEELAPLHAAARNMMGAFPFVALKLHRAESRIKELEEEIAQYKASEPTPSGNPRKEQRTTVSVDEEIDRLATARR